MLPTHTKYEKPSARSEKIRSDILITEQFPDISRTKAAALIMAGKLYVGEKRVDKPGEMLSADTTLTLRESDNPYVSRGGLKLEKAVKLWDINLSDKTCLDIGASTGGFTHCMLTHGAASVYAVDVGYGQLDYKLRTDERVVNLERTNFRHIESEQLPKPIDFASIDVSFISLRLILPKLSEFLSENARVVALVKPQFEAGRENVGKGGIVRDEAVRQQVLADIKQFAAENGYTVLDSTESPILGAKGNKEFLLLLEKEQK
jgi:hemolysin TlyA family protein